MSGQFRLQFRHADSTVWLTFVGLHERRFDNVVDASKEIARRTRVCGTKPEQYRIVGRVKAGSRKC